MTEVQFPSELKISNEIAGLATLRQQSFGGQEFHLEHLLYLKPYSFHYT